MNLTRSRHRESLSPFVISSNKIGCIQSDRLNCVHTGQVVYLISILLIQIRVHVLMDLCEVSRYIRLLGLSYDVTDIVAKRICVIWKFFPTENTRNTLTNLSQRHTALSCNGTATYLFLKCLARCHFQIDTRSQGDFCIWNVIVSLS